MFKFVNLREGNRKHKSFLENIELTFDVTA